MSIEINFSDRLASFSSSVQRHYGLYTRRFLGECLGRDAAEIDLTRLDGKILLPHLTKANLEAYLGKLKQDGQHQNPIQHTRSAILMLARELADRGIADYDLIETLKQTVSPRTEAGQDPGIWLSPEQSRRLLNELYAQLRSCTPPLQSLRARALTIVLVMLVCGLRCDEIVQMCWRDCQEEGNNHILRVHGKNSKLRLIKLPDSIVKTLDDWRALCGPIVLPSSRVFRALQWYQHRLRVQATGISASTIGRIIREAGNLIGIENLAPHDLRRTCARNAYLAGASIELIRQLLGHESILTTQPYINAPLALDHAASDIVCESLSLSLDTEPTEDEKIEPSNDPLLTREEAATCLGLNMPQFDRLRKRKGIEPAETRPGKTRPFALYRKSDVEILRMRKV
jgi:integrase/recombinase XerD